MYTISAWILVSLILVAMVISAFQEKTAKGAAVCFVAFLFHTFGIWLGYMAGGE